MVRQYSWRIVPQIEILIRQNVWRTPFSIRGTFAEHLLLKRPDAKSRWIAGPLNLIRGFETTSGTERMGGFDKC
jgi:hypothetical protein